MADKKEKVIVEGAPVDDTPDSSTSGPSRPYGPLETSPKPVDAPIAPSYADETAPEVDPGAKKGKALGVNVGMVVHYVLAQAETVNPLPVIPVTDVPPGTPIRGLDRAAVVTHVLDDVAGTVSLTIFTRGPDDGQNSQSGVIMRPSVGYDGAVATPDTWHFLDDAPESILDPDLDEAHQKIRRLERELAAAKADAKG